MLVRSLLAAAAVLIAYAVYTLTQRTRSCATCGAPVRERKANPWIAAAGATVYTHTGPCSDAYCNEYRAGEGP